MAGEKMEKFSFNNINPEKGLIVFTWDDNLVSHAQIIAPIFTEYHKTCSFYINPGEPDFSANFADLYLQLGVQGFEIGSHGYTHCHLSHLTNEEYIDAIRKARDSIDHIFHVQPTTFAFPHHDFNEKMLSQSRNIYFETRNSLYSSVRYSLKTATKKEQIDEAIRNAVKNRYTLVFSGHGAFDNKKMELCGYEPISHQMLCEFLETVEQYSDMQVCTFEQAALKTYIQYHCKTNGKNVWINDAQMSFLKQYGLTVERIHSLL